MARRPVDHDCEAIIQMMRYEHYIELQSKQSTAFWYGIVTGAAFATILFFLVGRVW